MIDGLGITGYEGVFLRVCEITLSVLRSHRGTLMSVLETFIHDPLVEWTKSHKSSGVEVQNPHAQVWISGDLFYNYHHSLAMLCLWYVKDSVELYLIDQVVISKAYLVKLFQLDNN